MAKGHGKSSATSATRKKHQKKVAAALGIDLDPSSPQPGKAKNKDKDKSGRGKKDGKKEPRAKVYIPPVKPVRAQPDPLEVGGLARRLPPELVVVLRNVGKKAQVTKVRALEELGNVWVERAVKVKGGGLEEEREEREDGSVDVDVVSSLVEMVPAWVRFSLIFRFCCSDEVNGIGMVVDALCAAVVYSSFSTYPTSLDIGPL